MDEIMTIFRGILTPDSKSPEYNNSKLMKLLDTPGFCRDLIEIMLNENIDMSYKNSAAIQLKNLVEKHWSNKSFISADEKCFLRNNILKCLFNEDNKISVYYSFLSEIVAKISRHDWNQNWPDLLTQLFNNNEWITIYRVCKVQSSRRVGQGAIIFKELVKNLTKEITQYWIQFQTLLTNDSLDNAEIINCRYKLKCILVFIKFSHMVESHEEDICSCFRMIANIILEKTPYYFDVYTFGNRLSCQLHKLIKRMILILMHHYDRDPKYFKDQNIKCHNYIIEVFYKLTNIHVSDKLVLLHTNFANNFLKTVQNNSEIDGYNYNFIELIRKYLLIQRFSNECLEDNLQNLEVDLQVTGKSKEEFIIYDFDILTEEFFRKIVKIIKNNSVDKILLIIETYLSKIPSFTWPQLQSIIIVLGYCMEEVSVVNENRNLLNCPIIVDMISQDVCKRNSNSTVSEEDKQWSMVILKQCIVLYGKWATNDASPVSKDRIIQACQWCFNTLNNNKTSPIINIAAALFIDNVVCGLSSVSTDFTDCNNMQNMFIYPAINIIVATINFTESSDSHAKLIYILKELFNLVKMWNDIELVKKCTESIYTLWTGITVNDAESNFLRESLIGCLTAIVDSCEAVTLQPILSVLSSFVLDTLVEFTGASGANSKLTFENSMSRAEVIFVGIVSFWHALIRKTEHLLPEYQKMHEIMVTKIPVTSISELSSDTIGKLFEIIQIYFLLIVQSAASTNQFTPTQFSTLTHTTWSFLQQFPWNPSCSEDLCIIKVQIFDLWLLAFPQLYKESPKILFSQIPPFSQFLLARFRELFVFSQSEPSVDQYSCLTQSVLTCLSRLCLLDRQIVQGICEFISSSMTTLNSSHNTQAITIMEGTVDRWLYRIDNLSSNLIQQSFLIAALHFLKNCHSVIGDKNVAREFVFRKLTFIIDCTLQVHANIDPNYLQTEQNQISQLPIPSDRHLRLAYLYWSPIGQERTNHIGPIIQSLFVELGDLIGQDNLNSYFNSQIELNTRNQFIAICQEQMSPNDSSSSVS